VFDYRKKVEERVEEVSNEESSKKVHIYVRYESVYIYIYIFHGRDNQNNKKRDCFQNIHVYHLLLIQ